MLGGPVGSTVMSSEPSAAPNRSAAGHSPTTAVVRAIAELTEQDPMELDFCLADHVDPDALNALVMSGDRTNDLELRLTVAEYEVFVESDGTVTARERTETSGSPETAVVDT